MTILLDIFKTNSRAIWGRIKRLLKKFDEEINFLYDKLIEKYSRERKIDKNLKQKNQLLWVQEMNNIRNAVNEYIHVK